MGHRRSDALGRCANFLDRSFRPGPGTALKMTLTANPHGFRMKSLGPRVGPFFGRSNGMAAKKQRVYGQQHGCRPRELDRFFFQYGGARELANSAAGILVFPSVVKAGFGFGRIRGRSPAYSGKARRLLEHRVGFVWLPAGAQVRSVIVMSMTPGALDQFQRTAVGKWVSTARLRL